MLEKRSVNELVRDFLKAEEADRPNRVRGIRNMLALTGVESSHWSKEERAQLLKEGFDVDGSYSVMGKFIRSLGGTFLDNGFNPRFLPNAEKGLGLDLASKVNKIYVSEKNKRRYKKSKLSSLRNGLAYRGIEEILIDRPIMSDPRTWGIDYRSIRPDEIVFDPTNKGDDIAGESEKCWVFSYHTIEDIKKMYPSKKEAISALSLYGSSSVDGPNADMVNTPGTTPHEARNHTKFNQYQIVSAYELVTEVIKSSVYIGDGEMVAIPDFGYKGDQETVARNLWAMKNNYNIDKDSGNVMTVENTKKKLYVYVFLPHLNLMLDSGEDERQIGRLPFFTWSYQTIMGISSGMIDLLWSTHKDIHDREAAKTKYIKKTPLQKPFVHSELFDGNMGELQKFINDWSESDKPLILNSEIPPGMAERYMGVTPGAQMPSIISSDESFKLQMLNEISGQTPASFGQTERSGESGTLNKQKIIESAAVQRFPLEMDSEYELEKAKAWIKLTPKAYGGAANYNRMFGEDVANILQGFDDEGNPKMIHDLSTVDTLSVEVVKDMDSDYYKQYLTEQAMGYLKNIQPTDTNAESISYFTQQLLQNRNFNSVEDKEYTEGVIARMREVESLKAEAAIVEQQARIATAMSSLQLTPSRTETEAANNMATQVQAQQMVQQIQQPQQPPTEETPQQ